MRDLGFSGGSKKGAKKADVEKAGAVAIAGLIAALVALRRRAATERDGVPGCAPPPPAAATLDDI